MGARWLEKRFSAPRMWSRLGPQELVLFLVLASWLVGFHHGFMRASPDGREYFVQVRSLIIDHDVDFSNENASFGVRGTAALYPVGTALLWSPFYEAAHLWQGAAQIAGQELSRDGYANPYQRAVGLGSLLYGFAALVLISRSLRRWFPRSTSLVAPLAVFHGSFIVWYLCVESSMSHGASLFAVTLFVVMWLRARERTDLAAWALAGLAAGMMTIVRQQNVLFALPALADLGVETIRSLRGSRRYRWTGARNAGGFGAAMILAVLPQMAFSWGARGAALDISLQDHTWGAPHVLEVLFSPDHGLFSWTPVLLIAVLGFVALPRRLRAVGGMLLGVLVLQVLVDSALRGWDGGSAFGARRFTASALVFSIGLAAAIESCRRRPWLAVAPVLLVLVAGNTFLMRGFAVGEIKSGESAPASLLVAATTHRIGNPFALPGALLFSWRHRVPIAFLDRTPSHLYGHVRIQVGSAGDDAFLAQGWHEPEVGPAGTFRWAHGPEAVVMSRLRTGP